jgi:hypothetical protein
MDGAAAVGTGTTFARADHVHPSDTSRAALAGAAFTGAVTVPTPAAADNSTNAATTAFVKTAIAALSAGGVTISDTAPASPTVGQLWWDSTAALLYVWYQDPTSSQWVNVNNVGSLPEAPTDGKLYARQGSTTSWQATTPAGTAGTGALVAFNSYTASQTIAIPAGATKAMVEMWGGVGGSGGVPAAVVSSATTAAAGYLRKFLTGLTPGNTLAFIFGAGGTAGPSGGAGGAGGASILASGTQTIATLTANGSAGGPAGTGTPAGGTATGGDINLTGQCSPAPIGGALGVPNTGVAGQTMYSTGTFGTSSGGSNPAAGFAGQPGGLLISWYA